MENIVWLAHGGPGSGRYPKGSGKNPRGVRKSIRGLNKLSRKKARVSYKLAKEARKNIKLNNMIDKARSKGIDTNRYEQKRKKNSDKLINLSLKIKDINISKEKYRKYIEDTLNTPLKVVRGHAVNKVIPYAIGPLLGVSIQTIPYNKFKKDKSRSKINFNKMGSKSFYNHINLSPKGSLPVYIDRTDYIYKKAGIKRKSR